MSSDGEDTQNSSRRLSTEAELERTRPQIEAWWAGRTQGLFKGVGGVPIAYAYIEPVQRRERAILISPGRTEYIDKYAETAFDLCQQGYAVYVVDHRGQGHSGRLFTDPHKGHVEVFDDYAEDMQRFIEGVLTPREPLAPVLLGHSMGGAIVARHLQLHPRAAAGAVLLSPMLAIHTDAPQWLIQPLLKCLEAGSRLMGRESGYVPGGSGYQDVPFVDKGEANQLTSSRVRLDYMNHQCNQDPSVQVGAPTRHWLLQAFSAMRAVWEDRRKIQLPVTVLLSGADRIVDNNGAEALVAALKQKSVQADCLTIKGAEHELLMEVDEYRLAAMHRLLDFIDKL